MTHTQIFRAVSKLIPADLMNKYGYLSYADMAEIEELSEWADLLRWAHQEWEKTAIDEAMFS